MATMRISIAGMTLLAMTAAAVAEDRVRVVKFPAGATATTIKGVVKGYDGAAYAIDAVAGQTMQLLFSPSNRSCYFNVTEPGASEAAHIGSTAGNEFSKNLTASGTYKADVYLMRNAARRKETCRYSFSVEITGVAGGASPGVSDMLMRDSCKGSTAQMYGVEPRNVRASATIRKTAVGYTLDGTIDKGKEGVKKMRCIFKLDRSLDHVMAMTPDGE